MWPPSNKHSVWLGRMPTWKKSPGNQLAHAGQLHQDSCCRSQLVSNWGTRARENPAEQPLHRTLRCDRKLCKCFAGADLSTVPLSHLQCPPRRTPPSAAMKPCQVHGPLPWWSGHAHPVSTHQAQGSPSGLQVAWSEKVTRDSHILSFLFDWRAAQTIHRSGGSVWSPQQPEDPSAAAAAAAGAGDAAADQAVKRVLSSICPTANKPWPVRILLMERSVWHIRF